VNYWELDEHTLGVGKTKVNPLLVVLIKFTLKKFQKKIQIFAIKNDKNCWKIKNWL
jgi:hypothetical protein